MLGLLSTLVFGTPISGHVDLPKDRPPEPIQLRFVSATDESVTLATSEISPEGWFRFDLDGLPSAAEFRLDSRWLWLPSRERHWSGDAADAEQPYFLHASLGLSVHGHVGVARNTDIAPGELVGARVRIAPASGNITQSVVQTLGKELTFAFDNLDPEPRYELRLEQDGFTSRGQSLQRSEPGQVTQLELRAERSVRLRGHVFSQDGSAFAGVRVALVPTELAANNGSAVDRYGPLIVASRWDGVDFGPAGCGASTGPDGSFAIERARAWESSTLVAVAPGFRSEALPLGVLRAGEARSDLQLLLTPHAEIEITAVDEHGDPVRGATIAAFDPDAEAWVGLCNARPTEPTSFRGAGLEDSSLDDWFTRCLPVTGDRGTAALRLQSDVKRVLLDLRDGDLVGFPPEPLALADALKVKVTVTLHRSTPVCIQFPSKMQPDGSDDVRVFDQRGWLRTGTLERGFWGPPYPWNAFEGSHPAAHDSLPGIRLAPLPAGRYTVKAVDATGRIHTKTIDLDPRVPRSLDLRGDQ